MTWGKAHGLGHINTFGTSGWQTGNQLSSLEAYLNILERVPGSVNQFNHPGTAYGTFDGFRDYNPRYDRLMQLMEVFGEPGTEYLSEYFWALDAGWHLAPTAGSFCYDPDFGNARTVILAQTLSESSLLQALRQRRAYATQDADLRLEFQLNGTDMGGFITKADTMELTAQFQDETDGAVGKVEVLTIHGRVLAIREITESAGEMTLTLPGGYPYYLLRVTQADGDVAISAPVWAETLLGHGDSGVFHRGSRPHRRNGSDTGADPLQPGAGAHVRPKRSLIPGQPGGRPVPQNRRGAVSMRLHLGRSRRASAHRQGSGRRGG